jgi:hypothetical protein
MTRPERSPKQTSPTLSLRLQEDVFLQLESQRARTGAQKSDFYRDLLLRGADASGLKSVKTGRSADARALLHVLHRIHQDCERIADLAHQAVETKAIDVSACDEITRQLDLMLRRLNAGAAA